MLCFDTAWHPPYLFDNNIVIFHAHQNINIADEVTFTECTSLSGNNPILAFHQAPRACKFASEISNSLASHH